MREPDAPLQISDVIAKVRELAEANPGFRYLTDENGNCWYLPQDYRNPDPEYRKERGWYNEEFVANLPDDYDGTPGCIMGQTLTALGVDDMVLAQHEQEGVIQVLDDLRIEGARRPTHGLTDEGNWLRPFSSLTDEGNWLEAVQGYQDDGMSWSEAIEAADNEFPL